MLPVVWLESALQDIASITAYITAYIADSSPSAAHKLNAKLCDDAKTLGQIVVHFRHGRVAGTHEFVSHPNYILVYRRSLIAVEILSVVHSRPEYP